MANVVADALSRKHMLLGMVDSKILGFELIKEYYEQDPDFREAFVMCQNESFGHYNIVDGFLFKANKLCIPKCATRELPIREVHGGGVAGHFGVHKTVELLQEHFYWPKMVGDVNTIISRCGRCQ